MKTENAACQFKSLISHPQGRKILLIFGGTEIQLLGNSGNVLGPPVVWVNQFIKVVLDPLFFVALNGKHNHEAYEKQAITFCSAMWFFPLGFVE